MAVLGGVASRSPPLVRACLVWQLAAVIGGAAIANPRLCLVWQLAAVIGGAAIANPRLCLVWQLAAVIGGATIANPRLCLVWQLALHGLLCAAGAAFHVFAIGGGDCGTTQ